MNQDRLVVLLSGGLDSVVLTCHLVQQGHLVRCLTVDYGQTQRKELDAAHYLASDHGWPHTTLPMGWFRSLAPHDGDVVPGRNAVLWSLATAHAQAYGCAMVAGAMHRGDHEDFPDCRPDFLNNLSGAMSLGYGVELYAPFAAWSKACVVQLGETLGVPFERTWSCYHQGPLHCGVCSSCTNRRRAFVDAAVDDPTKYQETPCAG